MFAFSVLGTEQSQPSNGLVDIISARIKYIPRVPVVCTYIYSIGMTRPPRHTSSVAKTLPSMPLSHPFPHTQTVRPLHSKPTNQPTNRPTFGASLRYSPASCLSYSATHDFLWGLDSVLIRSPRCRRPRLGWAKRRRRSHCNSSSINVWIPYRILKYNWTGQGGRCMSGPALPYMIPETTTLPLPQCRKVDPVAFISCWPMYESFFLPLRPLVHPPIRPFVFLSTTRHHQESTSSCRSASLATVNFLNFRGIIQCPPTYVHGI